MADGSSEKLSIKRNVAELPVYIAGLTTGAAELAWRGCRWANALYVSSKYMQKLKGEVADGAAKAGRDVSEIEITNGIPSFVSEDESAAIEAAKRGLSGYARFPFYQRLIKNIGYGDIVIRFKMVQTPPMFLLKNSLMI